MDFNGRRLLTSHRNGNEESGGMPCFQQETHTELYESLFQPEGHFTSTGCVSNKHCSSSILPQVCLKLGCC